MTTKQIYDWCTSGPWITEESTCTQWKYEVIRGVMYIAFEGSNSAMDWRQNFSFWVKPYKRMPYVWFAHAGFVEKWKSVEGAIFELCKSARYTNIVVAGFSQGAAIAQLCHESLRFHFLAPVETFAFASPRVVWFWNLWNIGCRFRHVHNFRRRWDIICHLPPWLFGYFHVGESVKIGSRWPSFKIVKNHMTYEDVL